MVNYDRMYKLIIFGDGGVGKTSLTRRYLTGIFEATQNLTIGADFFVKNLAIDTHTVKLQIWDFAGEERFRFLLPVYCKGANGGIFLYDVTNQATLQHLPVWTQIINENAPDIPILAVGTKIDLVSMRHVTKEEAVQMAKSANLAGYVEVSAKTGTNVEGVFESIAKLMVKRSS